MRVVSIWYNSKGEIEIAHHDNATKKRILQVLKKAVRKLEKAEKE
jgi:hypothetical protein